MDDQPVTRESLRDFLSGHWNWVEREPDCFHICAKHPEMPARIELQEEGALISFPIDADCSWKAFAGVTRFCSYRHLFIEPSPSYSEFAGSLMIRVNVAIVPPAKRPDPPPKIPDDQLPNAGRIDLSPLVSNLRSPPIRIRLGLKVRDSSDNDAAAQ